MSNVFNFGIYSIIYLLTSKINIASLIGYLVGLINSFYFSKSWVFETKKTIKVKKTFIIFTLIYLIGGLEMTILINIMYDLMDNFRIAWFFGASVAAINNFLFSKYFLFKN